MAGRLCARGSVDLCLIAFARCVTWEEYRSTVNVIGHYFGWQPTAEEVERFAQTLPPDRLFAVFDGPEIVAGTGSFPLELTVPGGPLPCAGVTVVGVLPSHRRQGLLTRMMKAQHRDIRERGEPLAALWASEETIYGRFGYGLSLLQLMVKGETRELGLRAGLRSERAACGWSTTARRWRRSRASTSRCRRLQPGFVSRSRDWWELRKLDDSPERRRGGGPLNRAIFEVDRPARRIRPLSSRLQPGRRRVAKDAARAGGDRGRSAGDARGLEIPPPDRDGMDELEAWLLPLDHPLLHLVARINLLRAKVGDGLWLRPVDVGAALSARSYAGDGRATLEIVSDGLFPTTSARGRSKRGGGPARRAGDQTFGSTSRHSARRSSAASLPPATPCRAYGGGRPWRSGPRRCTLPRRRAAVVPGDVLMDGRLSGKTAVITGASGGSVALPAGCLRRGRLRDRHDLDDESGGQLEDELADGLDFEFRACDFSSSADVAALLRRSGSRFGGLDILYNNAGVILGKPLVSRRPTTSGTAS